MGKLGKLESERTKQRVEKHYAAHSSTEDKDGKGIHIVFEIVSGINLPQADKIVGSVSSCLFAFQCVGLTLVKQLTTPTWFSSFYRIPMWWSAWAHTKCIAPSLFPTRTYEKMAHVTYVQQKCVVAY